MQQKHLEDNGEDMAKLSRKETVDGVLNGSIDKVSRTDALALLKELGFKDVAVRDPQGRQGAFTGVMMMKHKDIAAYVPVSKDAFLKSAEMLEFKAALAEVTKTNNSK